ncbi:unnamed protein product [Rotaria magnacalcarata]|nr:unnamed protein product [Rotaria magnacalcarata]CAF1686827.1 unnamed protein product [Rotaria magnacalcarata]CAF3969693.1 unnamed protein product [Rotaria magnacalcarata]
MIAFIGNPNSIQISMIRNRCLNSEFDSTYPIHLNGIIRQDEFHQSIQNINQAIRSPLSTIIYALLLIIGFGGGIVLLIVGVTASVTSSSGFLALLYVALGLLIFGILVSSFGRCIISALRTARLQQAVANESRKYSTRSPPCSWRLHVYTIGSYSRYQRPKTSYHLIIELANPGAPENGFAQ